MSPAASHFVVAMARATNLMRFAAKTASKYARRNVPAYINSQPSALYARITPGKHPIHPAAFLKQTRRFLSSTRSALNQALYYTEVAATHGSSAAIRPGYASSRIALAISQSTGHSAFASTLRPNLTGGAFPRTAGGYALGSGRLGGRRFFSHSPQPAAQVLQNVSQGMRAFVLQGKRAQYDGTDSKGRKRFRSVTQLQDKAVKKMHEIPKATPGAWVEFGVNPTITAITAMISPLANVAGYSAASSSGSSAPQSPMSMTGSEGVGLQTEGLLDVLQTDFSRALKELAFILQDIKALSALGDLPISYSASTGRLRVHFPGTDRDTVERIAAELGVRRGVIGQDDEFDAFVGTDIALMFPFSNAPSHATPSANDADQISETESEQLCGRTAYVVGADMGSNASQDMDHISEQSSFPASWSESPSDISAESNLDYEVLQALEDPWAPGTTRQRIEALRNSGQLIRPGLVSPIPSGETVSDLGNSTDSDPSPRALRRERYEPGTPLEYSEDFEGLYRFIEMCDRRRA